MVAEYTQIQTLKTERTRIRWMMVFYDTLLYVLCWFALLVAHPSVQHAPSQETMIFCLLAGYILFFGFRLVFGCYKQIWRYGSVRAFTKEFLACVLADVFFCHRLSFFGEKVYRY